MKKQEKKEKKQKKEQRALLEQARVETPDQVLEAQRSVGPMIVHHNLELLRAVSATRQRVSVTILKHRVHDWLIMAASDIRSVEFDELMAFTDRLGMGEDLPRFNDAWSFEYRLEVDWVDWVDRVGRVGQKAIAVVFAYLTKDTPKSLPDEDESVINSLCKEASIALLRDWPPGHPLASVTSTPADADTGDAGAVTQIANLYKARTGGVPFNRFYWAVNADTNEVHIISDWAVADSYRLLGWSVGELTVRTQGIGITGTSEDSAAGAALLGFISQHVPHPVCSFDEAESDSRTPETSSDEEEPDTRTSEAEESLGEDDNRRDEILRDYRESVAQNDREWEELMRRAQQLFREPGRSDTESTSDDAAPPGDWVIDGVGEYTVTTAADANGIYRSQVGFAPHYQPPVQDTEHILIFDESVPQSTPEEPERPLTEAERLYYANAQILADHWADGYVEYAVHGTLVYLGAGYASGADAVGQVIRNGDGSLTFVDAPGHLHRVITDYFAHTYSDLTIAELLPPDDASEEDSRQDTGEETEPLG